MKFPRLRTIVFVPVVLFALFYLSGVVMLALRDDAIAVMEKPAAGYENVVIFGASGTAGDGILKAALANPEISNIHVITRRITPRIEAAGDAGKVQMTMHMDYLDYSAIHKQIADADAVYWAIGITSIGTDEETYGRIHVDFPSQFVSEWLEVSTKPEISFHFISSSDISEDSDAMWVREKIRAEKTLFGLADGSKLRVIAYRPDYIGPTEEEAHLGQKLMYGFFAPVGAAIKAEQIGQAMFEVTARGDEFRNGDKVGTWKSRRYSDAYERRQPPTPSQADIAWVAEGEFCEPETVLPLPDDTLLVSNVCGFGEPGSGFLTLLSAAGEIIDWRMLDGLDAPLGMALRGDRLFVVDNNRVKIFSWPTYELVDSIAVDTTVANDVAVAADGSIFVTDTAGHKVIRHAPGGEQTSLLGDTEFKGANGIEIHGDMLYVGGARLWSVELRTEVMTTIGPAWLADIDGIEFEEDGTLQITPVGGPLVRYHSENDIEVLGGEGISSANHGYAPNLRLALIPTGYDNTVIAIRVPVESGEPAATN